MALVMECRIDCEILKNVNMISFPFLTVPVTLIRIEYFFANLYKIFHL